MDRLKTVQAHALRKAMLEARKALDEAYEKYQRILAVVMDADVGAEGELAMRQEGRAYAAALTRYSKATMTWLTYVDTQLRPKKADSAGESL